MCISVNGSFFEATIEDKIDIHDNSGGKMVASGRINKSHVAATRVSHTSGGCEKPSYLGKKVSCLTKFSTQPNPLLVGPLKIGSCQMNCRVINKSLQFLLSMPRYSLERPRHKS